MLFGVRIRSSRFRLSITTARFRNNLIRNSNRNQLHFHHLTRIRLSRRSWMIGRRDAHETRYSHGLLVDKESRLLRFSSLSRNPTDRIYDTTLDFQKVPYQILRGLVTAKDKSAYYFKHIYGKFDYKEI